jgi:hypothetical protein
VFRICLTPSAICLLCVRRWQTPFSMNRILARKCVCRGPVRLSVREHLSLYCDPIIIYNIHALLCCFVVLFLLYFLHYSPPLSFFFNFVVSLLVLFFSFLCISLIISFFLIFLLSVFCSFGILSFIYFCPYLFFFSSFYLSLILTSSFPSSSLSSFSSFYVYVSLFPIFFPAFVVICLPVSHMFSML